MTQAGALVVMALMVEIVVDVTERYSTGEKYKGPVFQGPLPIFLFN